MNKASRILIIYASMGSGHRSAAIALQKAILEKYPESFVEIADILPPWIPKSGAVDLMLFISSAVLPGSYDRTWNSGSMDLWYQLMAGNSIFNRRLGALLEQYKPDLVICTHTLACSVAASIKVAKPLLIAVATDFNLHAYWPLKGVDHFVVASMEGKNTLLARGFDAKRISILGIPVDPVFTSLAEKSKNPPKNSKIHVLVIAGAGKIGPYISVVSKVKSLMRMASSQTENQFEWTFVLGNGSFLYRREIEAIKSMQNVCVYGFTDKIPELILNSDVVVAKPGGAILAESLALKKPIALLSEGAGQERANAHYILVHGCGKNVSRQTDMLEFFQTLASNPEELLILKENAGQLGYPRAAKDVADLSIKIL